MTAKTEHDPLASLRGRGPFLAAGFLMEDVYSSDGTPLVLSANAMDFRGPGLAIAFALNKALSTLNAALSTDAEDVATNEERGHAQD